MVHLQVIKGYKRRSIHFILSHTLAHHLVGAQGKFSLVLERRKICGYALAWRILARSPTCFAENPKPTRVHLSTVTTIKSKLGSNPRPHHFYGQPISLHGQPIFFHRQHLLHLGQAQLHLRATFVACLFSRATLTGCLYLTTAFE